MICKKKNIIFKKFLLSKNSNFLSYSISALHCTYSNQNDIKLNFLNLIKKLVKNLLCLFDYKSITKSNKKVDIIVISNITNENINKDNYFGNLQNILQKKVNCLTVYRNLLCTKKFYFLKNKKISILPNKNIFYKEFSYIYLTLKEFIIYKFSSKYLILNNKLSFFHFISILGNLRLADQIKDLLEIYTPKVLLITFEGHAWERLAINMCKKQNVKCIAHQFSTIAPNQFGIFSNLKNEYNPDYIATSGSITKNFFISKSKFNNVFKLGSAKFTVDKKNFKKNQILVALDFQFLKMQEMLKYIITISTSYKTYNFLLRIHPIAYSDKNYLSYIKKNIKNIINIKLSNTILENNLKNSKFLIYRESSLSITCLKYNVIPIFFGKDKNLNVFDNKFPKINIINSKIVIDLKKIESSLKNKYFNNYKHFYFEKFNITKITSIIKNV
jgi:hypothetical protein